MTASTQRGVIPVLTDSQRLMVARQHVELTQGQLAERLGVGTATVQRAEAGLTKPRRTTFMAWSLATGVDLHWLETGEAPSPDDGDGASAAVRHQGLEPRTRWFGVLRAAHVADLDKWRVAGGAAAVIDPTDLAPTG